MKVGDIMQKRVAYISEGSTVRDAAKIIFGKRIDGVPVCLNKKVVGFITERDILDTFFPSIQEFIEDPIHEGNFEQMEAKVEEVFRTPAKKIMHTPATVGTKEMPVLRAESLMTIKKIGRLPIINKKGELIGILTKGDIFQSIVGKKII